jgi:hypothetical protein
VITGPSKTLTALTQELYGPTFNPQITLKALSFFDDGDLRQLPKDMKLRLVTAARNVDLDHLPSLDNLGRFIRTTVTSYETYPCYTANIVSCTTDHMVRTG